MRRMHGIYEFTLIARGFGVIVDEAHCVWFGIGSPPSQCVEVLFNGRGCGWPDFVIDSVAASCGHLTVAMSYVHVRCTRELW